MTRSDKPIPTPCAGPGEPVPDPGTVIVSNGETDANGVALGELIAFLRDSYGVERLHLVGHSDGGLWSRAAITQDAAYVGVEIQSLTTLGTPHTGSYLADLAIELDGGDCDFSNPVEQRICDVLDVVAGLVVADLGPDATYELSNDFLATWNAKQQIGACPVSGIAGDHVNLGIGKLLDYYTPSDGLVGLASAQAREALDINGHLIPAAGIPDFREAGVYDVVHGASLRFLSKKTLLNQPQISEQVAENTLLAGAEPCNVPAASGGSTARRATADSVQRLRAPLYRLVAADRRGRLPEPGAEDFVASKPGVQVRCGRNPLRPIPLLGDRRLRVHGAIGCEQGLRVRNRGGQGAAEALLLRSHPRRDVLARIDGDQARIRVRGRPPQRLRVHYSGGGDWKPLRLDDKGRTTLPKITGSRLDLEIRVTGGRRSRALDTAHLSLAR